MTDEAEAVVEVPAETPVEEVAPEVPQSVNEVALEVIAGQWGRGQVRRRRLEAAGWNNDEVVEEIAKIMNQ